MDYFALLTIVHIVGTVLGVGGETFGMIFYFKAMADGKVDPSESALLRLSFQVLRVGLVLLVLSGLGYLIAFRILGTTDIFFDARFVAKMSLVLILVFNAMLMHMRKIPLWIGGAISFTSWYGAMLLGVLRDLDYTYMEFTLIFGVSLVFVAVGERILRKRFGIPL